MEKLRTRYILVIGLLAIFGIMQGRSGYSNYTEGNNENPLKNFPLIVGEWSGEKNFVKDSVYRILETDAVIVNTYHKGEEVVLLSTVYYSDEKVDFHSPEGCSVGRGDKIDKNNIKSVTLDMGKTNIPFEVNELVVKRADGTTDLIYHFFKSGEFIGPSYLKFRYNMGLNFMGTRKTSGALIILTTPVVNNIQSSELALKNFMESFYSTWLRYL